MGKGSQEKWGRRIKTKEGEDEQKDRAPPRGQGRGEVRSNFFFEMFTPINIHKSRMVGRARGHKAQL